LEKRLSERMGEATRDLFVRLNKVVGEFAEAMGSEGKRFWDSKVEHIVEVVNLLPKLNISDDPELEKLRKETKRKLCALDPQNLREDSDARSKAADDAQKILEKMKGYCKA
jgi:hypothetical protein